MCLNILNFFWAVMPGPIQAHNHRKLARFQFRYIFSRTSWPVLIQSNANSDKLISNFLSWMRFLLFYLLLPRSIVIIVMYQNLPIWNYNKRSTDYPDIVAEKCPRYHSGPARGK